MLKKVDGGGLFRSPKYSVFGSSSHRYKLHPKLSEDELAAFEARHSIVLPEEYRDYLKEMGNGGAGPAYGILRLQDWATELDVQSPKFLSTPFPYTTPWNAERPGDVDDDSYHESEVFMAWEKEYYDNKHITGSIRLSHYGCAIYYFLVVTGEEKGFVWVDDRANDYGLYSAVSQKTKEKMSFSVWYHEWLRESLAHSKLD